MTSLSLNITYGTAAKDSRIISDIEFARNVRLATSIRRACITNLTDAQVAELMPLVEERAHARLLSAASLEQPYHFALLAEYAAYERGEWNLESPLPERNSLPSSEPKASYG